MLSSYVPERPDHYNNLETWDHTMGIWIRMNINATLTVEGNVSDSTEITLYPGWNMVGLPSAEAGNHGIPAEVTKVGYFDASEEYNLAYHYSPPEFVFEPGQGYWIYNNGDVPVTWVVNYQV